MVNFQLSCIVRLTTIVVAHSFRTIYCFTSLLLAPLLSLLLLQVGNGLTARLGRDRRISPTENSENFAKESRIELDLEICDAKTIAAAKGSFIDILISIRNPMTFFVLTQ